MTNPNNAVGTNGAYNGRTSVNAFNDDLALYSSAGVISGWALSPDSGMNIYIGGAADTRDVAVAEDAAGNRTTINNISGAPISVSISAAPAAGSRIDLVVAYVVNPPQGSETEVDNPAACGLIVVSGTASSTPVAPNDSAIRSAITADGAAGSTAYYVILGQATIPNGTTDIDAGMLSDGTKVEINTSIVPPQKVWLPDYANRDTGTNLFPGISGSSTITETGFIHIYLSGYNLQGAEIEMAIKINGVDVAGGTNSAGFAVVSVDDVVPVAAGDVITFTKSSAMSMSSTRNKIYFVPGRWV